MDDVISILRDRFIDISSGTPTGLFVILIKIAMWLCLTFVILYFSFQRYNRSSFLQMVIAMLLSLFCFFLPLEYVIPYFSALAPFLLCISALVILFMPRAIAYYTTPQRGNQRLVAYFLYVVIALLIIAQIILSVQS